MQSEQSRGVWAPVHRAGGGAGGLVHTGAGRGRWGIPAAFLLTRGHAQSLGLV